MRRGASRFIAEYMVETVDAGAGVDGGRDFA